MKVLYLGQERYSPDFTQLSPRSQDLFVHSWAIWSPRGTYSPDANFFVQNWPHTHTHTYTSLSYFIGTHLLLGQESARVDKVPSPRAQRHGAIARKRRLSLSSALRQAESRAETIARSDNGGSDAMREWPMPPSCIPWRSQSNQTANQPVMSRSWHALCWAFMLIWGKKQEGCNSQNKTLQRQGENK